MWSFILIYLYMVLLNTKELFVSFQPLFVILALVTIIILFGYYVIADEDDRDMCPESAISVFKKGLKAYVVIGLIATFVSVAVPSKDQVKWIIGGGVTYNVLSTDEARALPDNLFKAANNFLEGIDDKPESENATVESNEEKSSTDKTE